MSSRGGAAEQINMRKNNSTIHTAPTRSAGAFPKGLCYIRSCVLVCSISFPISTVSDLGLKGTYSWRASTHVNTIQHLYFVPFKGVEWCCATNPTWMFPSTSFNKSMLRHPGNRASTLCQNRRRLSTKKIRKSAPRATGTCGAGPRVRT